MVVGPKILDISKITQHLEKQQQFYIISDIKKKKKERKMCQSAKRWISSRYIWLVWYVKDFCWSVVVDKIP